MVPIRGYTVYTQYAIFIFYPWRIAYERLMMRCIYTAVPTILLIRQILIMQLFWIIVKHEYMNKLFFFNMNNFYT